ncbi:ABC transporter permease subunit [Alteromonas sp. C1M14]|uniref:ABC transporter permease subunit n=1 Tax=Alteromonas sp. C1M14 TaxID=2841567 RepID=UPI001C09F9E0|nr:ABC transporter permease subunit [Alteromonas sp. C1M14]MBU2977734.1 ABC transporter permease subunit [Alteromonas sp. C1M14]
MTSPEDIHNNKRQRKDRRLKFTVSLFGGMVLLAMVVLITHLASQALPLAMRPSFEQIQTVTLPDNNEGLSAVLNSGDLLAGQPVIMGNEQCGLTMLELNLATFVLNPVHQYLRPCDHQMTTIEQNEQQYIVDVSPAGQVRVIDVQPLMLSHRQPVSTVVSFSLPDNLWQKRISWQATLGERWLAFKIHTSDEVFVRWINRLQPTEFVDQHFNAKAKVLPLPGSATSLVYQGSKLAFHPLYKPVTTAPMTQPITWWQSLPKDRTVLIASHNTLTRWVLNNEQGTFHYVPTWKTQLASGQTPVDAATHATTNALAVLTNKQQVLMINRVTGETVSEVTLKTPATGLSWFGQNLYFVSGSVITVEKVNWLTGITTWASLFAPQHYEGYQGDDTVWQSTSGSDYQETKYSLVPLLIGSLKASLLALIIAIPVAIGAAVYTAYFSQARVRQWLKPAIELLEAIPSVLVGFIAAIWLAPMAERVLFSFCAFLIAVPVILFVSALIQQRIAKKLPMYFRNGTEMLLMPLLIVSLGYCCMQWGPELLSATLNTDFGEAISHSSGSPVGKTTVVVALALGVAISPTIYSLAEDAISGVPAHLKQASFALGATRLQTLHYVVLQLALPGILAAVMMGFGRAFGETMIVLMVTGNTPVADWHLFEGLRALTANLAIELPEADINSAHYQVLFFTACILFGFTFVINTVAELLRQRLRKKGQYD